jgi:beta-lactamase regulating signal transducer with metallopeptidase domain
VSDPLVDILFEALANGTWHGVLLVLGTTLFLRLFTRTTAAERYAIWLAVLAVIALEPFVVVATRAVRQVEPTAAFEMREVVVPPVDGMVLEIAAKSAASWQPVEVDAIPLLLAWLVGAGFLAVRLWWSCARATGLKRQARAPELDLARAVAQWERGLSAKRVGSTRVLVRLHSPVTVGWLRPAVLLPVVSSAEVRGADVEMLWRHEQAHVSRIDDWTQLLSECLFALSWFNPAIHWVQRQLKEERELACDEAVVSAGVEVSRYVGALGRWAERAAMGKLSVGVMGVGRSKAQIIRRIEMLLSPYRILRRGGGWLAFGAGLLAAFTVAGLLAVLGPELILAQSVEERISVVADHEIEIATETGNAITTEDGEKIVVEPPVVGPVVEAAPATAPIVNVRPVLSSQLPPPAGATPVGGLAPLGGFAPFGGWPPDPGIVPVAALAPMPQAPPAPLAQSAPAAPPRPLARLAQAAPPVPPAPPAPPRRSADSADRETLTREVRDQVRTINESTRRWHESIQPQLGEIQREAARIQELVQAQLGPQHERIQGMAAAMSELHQRSMEPLAEEMAQLGAQMGQASEADRKELQAKMRAVGERMRAQRPEFQRLQEQMAQIQIEMRPIQEEIRKMQEGLRFKAQELRKAEEALRDSDSVH